MFRAAIRTPVTACLMILLATLVLPPSPADVMEARLTRGADRTNAVVVAAPATPGTPEALDETTLLALSILGVATGGEPGVTNVATLGTTIGLPPGGAVALVLGVFDL